MHFVRFATLAFTAVCDRNLCTNARKARVKLICQFPADFLFLDPAVGPVFPAYEIQRAIARDNMIDKKYITGTFVFVQL